MSGRESIPRRYDPTHCKGVDQHLAARCWSLCPESGYHETEHCDKLFQMSYEQTTPFSVTDMTYDQHLVSLPWSEYELLDSGDNMKLERFGEAVVARPETQALWKKQKPELWDSAHAVFAFRDAKGSWNKRKPVPESWPVVWHDVRLSAHLTGFKHTGIFPEQAPNWKWIQDVVRPDMKVLNLFGYTGAASIV